MTLYGYAGKILRLDMTNRKAIAIDTEPYRRWGGGHGMGAALFWDFCKDKTITDGRHPANVCCVVTSPLCGTIVPSAGGRCAGSSCRCAISMRCFATSGAAISACAP